MFDSAKNMPSTVICVRWAASAAIFASPKPVASTAVVTSSSGHAEGQVLGVGHQEGVAGVSSQRLEAAPQHDFGIAVQ